MKKQPEVTERTKAILMDSFWQLYRENDIRKITIKDITEKAGYNRSTFYQYFVDVYDLLNQLEDSLIQYISDNVKLSLVSSIGDDFIEQMAQLYDLKGEYISVLLSKNGDPMFAEKLKSALSFIIFDKLEIKRDKAHMDLMFEFAISGMLSAITKWYNLGKPIPSKEMVVMLRSMLFKGASSYIR
ncbi:regulatory protein TetR [Thermoanaerobacterium xylanolyticum LX-11]|uniref:Regulatory protein TetR n=1 Tax=Thermoanaerobacterium xylanolyticum (strain ATCC 49914 / DSM 7097 / LX-11) TaxID=858215 RepID=F6BI84_THEXL|nr:TetR/AcrR family transcriptional regulator [Thermoanaerobacterium xylanolyticum]AEF16692.1 regulatory protein TetR [Thermoanaerobacterium xylanolyticum LX-11]